MTTNSLSSTISSLKENEVYLGGHRLPIRGKIQLVKATQHPGKISVGKITRADQVLADEWIQGDWRDGMLIYYLDEQLHTGRFFWSTCDTRWMKKMMLPPLATTIGNPTTTNPADVVVTFNGALHVSFGGKVYKWDDNAGWGSLLHDLGGVPTDAVVFNQKLYYAMGGTGYWQYDPTGPTWTAYGTPSAQYFCLFDTNPSQKLMVIDGTKTIQASTDGVVWSTNIGGQITEDVTVTHMISARNANDEPTVFVGTTTGLFNIDVWTKTTYKTSLQVLPNATNGRDLVLWSDGSLYFPSGLSLWRYPRTGDIVNIGLDKDEGLPVFIRGKITHLDSHPTYLLAAIDTTQVSGTSPTLVEPFVLWSPNDTNFGKSNLTGSSAIVAFNGTGWHTLYLSSFSGTSIAGMHLDTSYNNGERRLFFGDGTLMKYITMPEGNYNPILDPNATFDPSGVFTTAWFDGGYTEIIKLALSLKMRVLDTSATEYVDVYYAINDQTNFTYLGTASGSTVDSGGRVVFPISSPSGLQFYNIQFQFVFHRGSNTGNSPALLFFDLRYKRMPAVLWGWTFTVIGTDPDHLEDIWQKLKTMTENRLTYLFGFRNNSDTTVQPVEVVGLTGIEFGGSERTSYFTATVIELEKG